MGNSLDVGGKNYERVLIIFGKVGNVYKRRFSYKNGFNHNLCDYFVDFK